VELAGGLLTIPSFSDSSGATAYKVDPATGYCQCPRYAKTGSCLKHPALARAVLKARSRRCHSRAVEEELLRLCRELFAPVRVLKRRSPRDSYALMVETLCYEHSTDELKRRGFVQHHRVLVLSEASDSEAANRKHPRRSGKAVA